MIFSKQPGISSAIARIKPIYSIKLIYMASFYEPLDLSINRPEADGAFKCGFCGKIFDSPSDLEEHIIKESNHHGPSDLRYRCEHCPFSTNELVPFNQHMRTHNNGLYKCYECYKTFKRNSKLEDHERVHTGERPFQCQLCVWSFKKSSHLVTHMKLKHPIFKNWILQNA